MYTGNYDNDVILTIRCAMFLDMKKMVGYKSEEEHCYLMKEFTQVIDEMMGYLYIYNVPSLVMLMELMI